MLGQYFQRESALTLAANAQKAESQVGGGRIEWPMKVLELV